MWKYKPAYLKYRGIQHGHEYHGTCLLQVKLLDCCNGYRSFNGKTHQRSSHSYKKSTSHHYFFLLTFFKYLYKKEKIRNVVFWLFNSTTDYLMQFFFHRVDPSEGGYLPITFPDGSNIWWTSHDNARFQVLVKRQCITLFSLPHLLMRYILYHPLSFIISLQILSMYFMKDQQLSKLKTAVRVCWQQWQLWSGNTKVPKIYKVRESLRIRSAFVCHKK